MSKARVAPWICQYKSPVCLTGASVHCPNCDTIFCNACFDVHKLKGCRVYTGTDQCLCIWEPGAEYPACAHDIRGHKGAQGIAGKFMDCQRIASFKIKFRSQGNDDQVFSCREHVAETLFGLLVGRTADYQVSVALYPVVNEKPCEHGVE